MLLNKTFQALKKKEKKKLAASMLFAQFLTPPHPVKNLKFYKIAELMGRHGKDITIVVLNTSQCLCTCIYAFKEKS